MSAEESLMSSAAQAIANRAASGGIPELAAAYVAAWGELPVGVQKDATNPAFHSDYATLEAHLNLIKPVFKKHGLAILQSPGLITDGNMALTTILLHKSGQSIAITSQVPLGGKLTAQSMGSGATYGSRYVLRGIGGLAATDDDGEAASQSAQKPVTRKAARKDETEMDEARQDYAARADQLIAAIGSFTGTVDELEKQVRPLVEEMGDEKINKAYVEKRRALKGAKK